MAFPSAPYVQDYDWEEAILHATHKLGRWESVETHCKANKDSNKIYTIFALQWVFTVGLRFTVGVCKFTQAAHSTTCNEQGHSEQPNICGTTNAFAATKQRPTADRK